MEAILSWTPATPSDYDQVLETLLRLVKSSGPLDESLTRACLAARPNGLFEAADHPGKRRSLVSSLYSALGPESRIRFQLLRSLILTRDADSLAEFLRLSLVDPPKEEADVALAYAPLFQIEPRFVAPLFPELLGNLDQPATFGVLLDLSNWLTKNGFLAEHPAAPRATQLGKTLAAVAHSLCRVEEQLTRGEVMLHLDFQRIAGQSIGWLISIASSLAMIGDKSQVGKLRQGLLVPDRGVRVSVAKALATLGEEEGFEVLADLSRDPVAREAALGSLEYLRALERVPREFRSGKARAEGRIHAKLEQDPRLRGKPRQLRLLDRRRLFWPAENSKVRCSLFRFRCQSAEGRFEGVAFAGPSVDFLGTRGRRWSSKDLYAAFAGRVMEHEEILETPISRLSNEDLTTWRSVRESLRRKGYRRPRLVCLATTFETLAWVAKAKFQGRLGVVITEGGQPIWRRRAKGESLQTTAETALAIHRGGIFHHEFNRDALP